MGARGLCQRCNELNDVVFRIDGTQQRDIENWDQLCRIELSSCEFRQSRWRLAEEILTEEMKDAKTDG
jgi:hypothetical protein